MTNERRLHPRYPLRIDATCSTGSRTIVVPSRDVSLGGIFLFTTAPEPIGADVRLKLHLEDLGDLEVDGRVAHHIPGVGMGVEFQGLSAIDRRRLDDYIVAARYCLELRETHAVPPTAAVDRRKHPRIALKTSVRAAGPDNFYAGLSGDVSEGGLFVAADELLPTGSTVDLEFSLPDGGRPIHARGEVRWHRAGDARPGARGGMGIKFVGLHPEERARIQAFSRRRQAELYEDG